jgi:hypothetical protein
LRNQLSPPTIRFPRRAKISSGNDFNHDTYTWPAENNNFATFPPPSLMPVTQKYQFTGPGITGTTGAPERRMPVEEIQRTNPFRLGYFIWSAARNQHCHLTI